MLLYIGALVIICALAFYLYKKSIATGADENSKTTISNNRTSTARMSPSLFTAVENWDDLDASTLMSSASDIQMAKIVTREAVPNSETAIFPANSERGKLSQKDEETKKSDRDVKTWDTATQAQMAVVTNLDAKTPTVSEATLVKTSDPDPMTAKLPSIVPTNEEKKSDGSKRDDKKKDKAAKTRSRREKRKCPRLQRARSR
uniref:Uncharacterized protein n=1 Tax=Acrobeloides nanus TaxID=290746 RepID=A0A914D508_9BILA